MNKKIILPIALLMMISFCTGIFVQILTSDGASLSAESPSFFAALSDSLKSDISAVLLAAFFAATIILMPATVLLVLAKTFSLGFSAAWLLASCEHGLGILLAVLLPRSILKLPAYGLLIYLSFETAKLCQNIRQNKRVSRPQLLSAAKGYLLCFLMLAGSSLIEVLLLQAVS